MAIRVFYFFIVLFLVGSANSQSNLKEGFCYTDEAIENFKVDLRYFQTNNFLGRPVKGYFKNVGILTCETVNALGAAAKDLKKQGLGLILFDGYRPQQAVDDFVAWSNMPEDTANKAKFYPHLDKTILFPSGYISSKSRHSSGSTVDIGLYNLTTGALLDMGSPFDFFEEKSHHDYEDLTIEQKNNRLLLKSTLLNHGFRSYQKEWWHYTLNDEPFKNQYFNFPIK